MTVEDRQPLSTVPENSSNKLQKLQLKFGMTIVFNTLKVKNMHLCLIHVTCENLQMAVGTKIELRYLDFIVKK